MDDSRFHAEESLEKCLADAYESMSPDEEARRRMLAELLAASEQPRRSGGRPAGIGCKRIGDHGHRFRAARDSLLMPSSLSVQPLALSRRHRGIPCARRAGVPLPCDQPAVHAVGRRRHGLVLQPAPHGGAGIRAGRRTCRRRAHRRAAQLLRLRLPGARWLRLVRRIDPDERLSLERPDEAAGHGIRHREGRRRFVRGRQPRVPHRRLGVDGRP